MGLKRTSEPATSPVTLIEAKAHLRVTSSSDDTAIQSLIDAVTSFVEDYTGRSLITQTWRLTLDDFADSIVLPRGPVASVTSLQYYDTAGALQTFDSAGYTLDDQSDPAFVVLNDGYSWPSLLDAVNVVRVTYVTGYSTLPAAIKHAVLVTISDWYNNREGQGDIPVAAMALLQNHRAFA